MANEEAFRRLRWNTLIALLLCVFLVAFCYFFVDRWFAYSIHANTLGVVPALKWLTYPPTVVEACVPPMLVLLMIQRTFRPLRRWELSLLTACVSLVLAEQFRTSLAYVCGRTWPETWVNNNPSLIQDGVYGFHPFHGGEGYASFPSGHTARTLAVVAVFWVAYPRWRWACIAGSVIVPVGLLGMNYHFVGDVVAGGFIGALIGTYAAYCCRLKGYDS